MYEDNANEVKRPGRNGNVAPPAPKKNKFALKYYSLVKLIKNRRGALNKRTILGKMVQETGSRLEADLGGDLSTAERMLVTDGAGYLAPGGAQQHGCRRSADHQDQKRHAGASGFVLTTDGWDVRLWPEGYEPLVGKVYTVRIPVPAEPIGESITASVEPKE
jgi:hypothetical protein